MSKGKMSSNIRRIRLEKNMTLKDLGEKTDLSISYLSMIERGLTSISLSTLQKISEALGVGQTELSVQDPHSHDGIVRSYQSSFVKLESSNSIFSDLIDNDIFIPRPFDSKLITILQSHNIVPSFLFTHSGEEFIYILEGMLTLLMGKQTYVLSAGDSAHYHSSIPHEWLNRTDRLVKFLAINSDPHADYYGHPDE